MLTLNWFQQGTLHLGLGLRHPLEWQKHSAVRRGVLIRLHPLALQYSRSALPGGFSFTSSALKVMMAWQHLLCLINGDGDDDNRGPAAILFKP